jgi:hypothetical protein
MSQLIAAATISSKCSTEGDYNPSGCSNASYVGATHVVLRYPLETGFFNIIFSQIFVTHLQFHTVCPS